jgi:RNA polymerase sigma-70 factor (ECF subfamily)
MTGAIIMKSTQYNSRSNEWAGDLTVWLRENAEDNSEQLARLHKNLRRAREQELTLRQRQIVELHYEQGLSVTQIAHLLHINPSTVSRTLSRAHERLRRCLQYTF